MRGNVRPENDTCPLPILIVLTHHWMTGILTGVCKGFFPDSGWAFCGLTMHNSKHDWAVHSQGWAIQGRWKDRFDFLPVQRLFDKSLLKPNWRGFELLYLFPVIIYHFGTGDFHVGAGVVAKTSLSWKMAKNFLCTFCRLSLQTPECRE